MRLSTGWHYNIGLLCLCHGSLTVQFGIQRDCQTWGYFVGWMEGPLYCFGLGPVVLVTYAPYS
jgi:hypothetical protein